MIMVSSCLLGIYSRYDGGANTIPLLTKYLKTGKILPICPEQLGGLATPRRPVEIAGGAGVDVLDGSAKAITPDGDDVSSSFVKGAQEVLAIARAFPVTAAILKERSPSCGVHKIYDGSFNHVVREGQGVTAGLLRQLGVPLYSEDDLTEELLQKLLDRS